jgi:hypothetical protein
METNTPQPENIELKPIRPFLSRPWVRFLVIFSAGFLAALILFTALKRHDRGTTGATGVNEGTVVEKPAPTDTLTALEPLKYDTPLARVLCSVSYSVKAVEIRVDLSSLYPVKMLVEFDVNNLGVISLENVRVNDQSSTLVSAGVVQFSSVGDNRYLIRLSNHNNLPHQVGFRLTQNDLTLFQKELMINTD